MRLAECLGLDTRKYQITNHDDAIEKDLTPLESTISDEERFRDAARLTLRCRLCRETFTFEGIIKSREHVTAKGIVCSNVKCAATLSAPSVAAQLECQLRRQTNLYYEGWLVCSNPQCGNRTRQLSVRGKRCLGPQGILRGCEGKMGYEYSAKRLYNQLLYYQTLFDLAKARSMNDSDINASAVMNEERFDTFGGVVEKYLKNCGRRWVSMDNIFSFYKPVTSEKTVGIR